MILCSSKGINGLNGDDGLRGEQGSTGLQGEQGDTGSTGVHGDTGSTGASGLMGPQVILQQVLSCPVNIFLKLLQHNESHGGGGA